MHATMDEIRSLADSYVKGKLLDDEQLSTKRHMSGCDECYELFCTEYLLLKNLREYGLLPEKEPQFLSNCLLKIQIVENSLKVLQGWKENVAACWEFLHIPQLAMARGSSSRQKADMYVNKDSEYSFIKYEGDKIMIQLDAEAFPVDHLTVLLTAQGSEEEYPFSYNEETECYQAVIDCEKMTEDAILEVVDTEDEE